jgi:hypothetical protein
MPHARLPKGKPPPIQAMRGRTLEHDLAEAGRKGDVAQAEELIAHGADVRNPMCIEYADVSVMRTLLAHGVNPTTALQCCTNSFTEPSDEKVRLLLSAGADADAVSRQGFSSVAHALDRLHADTFLILVEAGGRAFVPSPGQPVHNPAWDERLKSARDRFGTPRAEETSEFDRARRIAQGMLTGSPIQAPIRSLAERLTIGRTVGKERRNVIRILQWFAQHLPDDIPLDERVLAAVAGNNTKSMRRLLDAGLSPDHRVRPRFDWLTFQGMKVRDGVYTEPSPGTPAGTPMLHWAVGVDAPAMCRLLVKHGADIRANDQKGYTAAHVARVLRKRDRCLTALGIAKGR